MDGAGRGRREKALGGRQHTDGFMGSGRVGLGLWRRDGLVEAPTRPEVQVQRQTGQARYGTDQDLGE